MILLSSRSALLSVYYPQIFLILTSGSYLHYPAGARREEEEAASEQGASQAGPFRRAAGTGEIPNRAHPAPVWIAGQSCGSFSALGKRDGFSLRDA
ncbi:UNVERIFIED_CONTAM: hypothetical protein K2H54_020912 [Gekko kuhli]